jgi:hypothetical protein
MNSTECRVSPVVESFVYMPSRLIIFLLLRIFLGIHLDQVDIGASRTASLERLIRDIDEEDLGNLMPPVADYTGRLAN